MSAEYEGHPDLVDKARAWDEIAKKNAEIVRLRTGLTAAIRAAKLALFVIHKQGVMPNSSWEGGFKDDLATAESAMTTAQRGNEK